MQRPGAKRMLVYSRGTTRLEEEPWDESGEITRGRFPKGLGGQARGPGVDSTWGQKLL